MSLDVNILTFSVICSQTTEVDSPRGDLAFRNNFMSFQLKYYAHNVARVMFVLGHYSTAGVWHRLRFFCYRQSLSVWRILIEVLRIHVSKVISYVTQHGVEMGRVMAIVGFVASRRVQASTGHHMSSNLNSEFKYGSARRPGFSSYVWQSHFVSQKHTYSFVIDISRVSELFC